MSIDRPLGRKIFAIASLLALLLAAIGYFRTGDFRTSAEESQADESRTYTLRNSEAQEVAPQLRRLLTEMWGPTEILVNKGTNRIRVEGPAELQQLASQLLATLDRPTGSAEAKRTERKPAERGNAVARGYRVPAERLEQITEEWQTQFGHLPAVRIVPDARTHQLIVVAPPDVHDQMARHLVDGEGEAEPRVIERGDREQRAAAPKRPLPPRNSAQAALPPRTLKNLTSQEFEGELKSIWGNLLVFTMENNDTIATVRLPTSSPEPALVQIDRRRNQVSFAGPADMHRPWDQIVQALDRRKGLASGDAQIVPVGNADPEQVQRTISLIQTSFTNRADGEDVASATLRRGADRNRNGARIARAFQPNDPDAPADAQPPAPDEPGKPMPDMPDAGEGDEDGALMGPVEIEYIEGLDLFIIKGNKRDVARVVKMIEEIEASSGETMPLIEIVHLRYGNNQSLAELISQVYEQMFATRQGRVSITGLVKPNALLLIGRAESVKVVKDLIAKLDQPVLPTAQWKVYPLKYASASDAEATVRNLFNPTQTGAPGGPAPGGPGAGPAGAATTGNLRPRVTVIADYRVNSLVVQASPRDLAEVSNLIKQIDVESGPATSELRVFKLTHSLAPDMATTLQNAIRGQSSTGQGGQQNQQGPFQGTGGFNQQQGGAQGAQTRSTNLSFVTVDAQGHKIIATGIPSDVVVTAAASANELIVRAPAKAMELIAALIAELDSLPDAQSQIKVFTIVNGDATNLTATLQQLFGQQVTAGRGTGGLFGAAGGQPLNIQPQTGGPNAGESSLVPLRFAPEARTNSIISSGSSGDLAVVEALLLRLDEGDVPTREMTVYRLKNAVAIDVANAITNFLQSQRQVIQQSQIFNQAIGPFEQLEREVIVVAEPQSNSVIVSATPHFFNKIQKIIEDLDFRPPMVMVQVLIAEVRLSDFYEFGVELGLQDSLLFDRGKAALAAANPQAVPGFNFNTAANGLPGLPNVNSLGQGTVAPQGVSTFNLGRTGPLGYGGLVLSAASDSVNVLIRALQDANRLQVLSRPQVMAIHNKPAEVFVGALVPRVQGTTVSVNGNTSNVQDVQVGLILQIIPRINDDGIIVLDMNAKKSALNTSSTPITISPGVTQQQIDTTSAFTTISARNDQTVVFAGLISSTKTVLTRRIPYLSDIPIVGKAFEYTQDTDSRSELLIIMTPHIVKYDEDYEWIKAVESGRMNWCLGDVVNLHGDVGLRGKNCIFCPGHIPVCYPDDDPTGSAIPYGGDGPELLPQTPIPAQSSGTRGVPTPVMRDRTSSRTTSGEQGPLQRVDSQPRPIRVEPASHLYGPPPRAEFPVAPANYDNVRDEPIPRLPRVPSDRR